MELRAPITVRFWMLCLKNDWYIRYRDDGADEAGQVDGYLNSAYFTPL